MQSMNLQQSMRERHGWSAPWLPGLWLMPDGSVFHPAQSSLLVSLQMYFERGVGCFALYCGKISAVMNHTRDVLELARAQPTWTCLARDGLSIDWGSACMDES